MKKVLAVILLIAAVMSLTLPASALGKFYKSPSGNRVPELITYKNDDGCDAYLIITPYAQRNTLPDDLKAMIEEAYWTIANATDLTTIMPGLKAIADAKNIDYKNLAVSDLFDVRWKNCEKHAEHSFSDVEIESENLKGFVAFMHYNKEHKWEVIEDATVSVVDGKYRLHFSIKNLSPFAIVIDGSSGSSYTGDNSRIGLYIAIMAASAASLVTVAVIIGKRRKNNG